MLFKRRNEASPEEVVIRSKLRALDLLVQISLRPVDVEEDEAEAEDGAVVRVSFSTPLTLPRQLSILLLTHLKLMTVMLMKFGGNLYMYMYICMLIISI